MKYVLSTWPEVQKFEDHPRWNECIYCIAIEGHPVPDYSYMIPEDLYDEVINKSLN